MSYYNFDDVMMRLDDIESKIDKLIDMETKNQAFQVIATKGKKKLPVADYIFEKMQEAILFQKQMVEKGYDVELNRKWI